MFDGFGDKDRFIFIQNELVLGDSHLGHAADYNPVFTAMEMHLQAEHLAGIHDDSLHLVAKRSSEHGEKPPRTINGIGFNSLSHCSHRHTGDTIADNAFSPLIQVQALRHNSIIAAACGWVDHALMAGVLSRIPGQASPGKTQHRFIAGNFIRHQMGQGRHGGFDRLLIK